MKDLGALAIVGVVIAWTVVTGLDQQEPQPTTKTVMWAKLDHSKNILEGLTTENFDLIGRHAQALALLSHEQAWRVVQTEEYAQRSAEFRRAVDALTNAAKQRNLDGATVAYVDTTLKCVECHQYVRRIRTAAQDTDKVRPERKGAKS